MEIWSLLCPVIGFISPFAIIFCLDVLVGHVGLLTSKAGILRQFAPRP